MIFFRIALQVRCQLAQELLRTDLTVKEVAYLTGYSDVANFSAAFKAKLGVSLAAMIDAHLSEACWLSAGMGKPFALS